MKRGQIVEGFVEGCDYPCKARVKCEEGIVSVKNALPGQKVSIRIGRSHGDRADGTLLEVLERGPEEKNKVCAHFGNCGGCAYLSMCGEEEARLKEEQIVKLLSNRVKDSSGRYGTEALWEGILDSPVKYGYRNKMEFSFGNEVIDGPLNVGLHRRGAFHDILDVSDCMIIDEDYRKILVFTRDYFRQTGTHFYHKKDHEGFLRNLVIRKAAHTGEILICPVTASDKATGTDHTGLMKDYVSGLLDLNLDGKVAGILQIINDQLADAVIADDVILLYGSDHINESLLDLKFKIGPFSFFQTNTYSAEVLYSKIREYVSLCGGTEGKTVFDLYSGTGTIAQIAAANASKVVGVEIIPEAVEAAKKGAAENGNTNCEFICGDVLKVLDDLEEKPDIIILDPPRDGIHPKALPKILGYGVEHIIYVSCKPTSLERDLEEFLNEGYMIERYSCINQFPWTKEVETAMLLKKV
jgi:23S rRNA (uracil-5-)-methyltransferase RumA